MTTPRPLEGRTIVVTRAAEQARALVERLEAAGARVLALPTIAIEPPPAWDALDRALDDLARFTWAIFTSVNGVAMVDRRLGERRIPWSPLGALRVAAIGPATAEALAAHGVHAEIVPGEYRAEGLVAELRGRIGPGDRVLLPRAARTRDVLVRELEGLGISVTEVPAYATHRVAATVDRLRSTFAAGAVDAVTFTSSSTARHFAELFSAVEREAWLGRVVVAAIGPITAATAAEYGLPARVMPAEYTIPALAQAIVEHFGSAARAAGRPGKGAE